MRAVVIERRGLGPGVAQNLKILVGTGVASILVEEVAVALQVAAVAPGDHVDRSAATAELVKGGELARGESRRLEAGAVRDQQADAFGQCRHVGGEDHRVWRAGVDCQQRLVETGVFLGLGERLDELEVD